MDAVATSMREKPSSRGPGSQIAPEQIACAVERDGFALLYNCLDELTVEELCVSLGGSKYGQRNLLREPAIQKLARRPEVRRIVESVLGPNCSAVKGILFNKTRESNWKVPWHQDLTITVQDRLEVAGFGPWTIKAGVNNVQPPASVLRKILAIRIHLDDNDNQNGPLRVIPGSHQFGRLTREQVAMWDKSQPVACLVPRRGALLMRPLLLHASSACKLPQSRRVIHLEYCSAELPNGLCWHSRA